MNPIELAERIEERYRRYLHTTFYFKDPELRKSFEESLNSRRLSKGPFLEATPIFKRGRSPRALFHDLLKHAPDEGFLQALRGDRPLYIHQEQAIQKVFGGHNVVIATGTGSGKTEAFLYPILLHLYQEFQAGNLCPGVRALILYPMNALANDQRERLEEICKRLKENDSPFCFTFGQYIGETPEDEADSKRHARDLLAERNRKGYCTFNKDKVVHGELILRSEMRCTPPHILLTNYSMLEYLLLRPYDSPIFDNGNAKWWTFLVLDEAHQYRGSRGIEMGMLLRRLKQRIREGGRIDPFRCIATSATLIGDESDKKSVAHFASDLFGEEFLEGSIILGETQEPPKGSNKSLTFDDYKYLSEFLKDEDDDERLSELARLLSVRLPSENETREKKIGAILQNDHRTAELIRLVTDYPFEVREIADRVFEDLSKGTRVNALIELVELLLQARDPTFNTPLLSARYHLILRSLEGAFVSYWPQKRVFIERKSISEQSAAFEVALCRECGQHYFVAQKDFNGGVIQEAIKDPSDVNFGATFLRPIESDEDLSQEDDIGTSENSVFFLCVECGKATLNEPNCGHNHYIRVVKEKSVPDEDRADQLSRCGACGYNAAGHDPVREVIHGTDGPHAVITTTLYQSLPDDRKKILAFADSRQEAAFFAWYLEQSYRDILSRNLLNEAIQRLNPHTPEGVSLRELATELCTLFREKQVLPPATGNLDLRREAWIHLYREFLTDEPRISLEGVGLIRWSIKWPNWFEIPLSLNEPPWLLTSEEAYNLILVLLDTMRVDRAVELLTESGISLNWHDLRLQGSQMRFRIGDPKKRRGVRSWDGKHGKRAKFLVKLLARTNGGLSEQEAVRIAVSLLRELWESIRRYDENSPSPRDRLLLSVDDTRRLNPDWWRIHSINDDDTVYKCNICGRLEIVSVRGICPRHRCMGTLEPLRVSNLEPNHYRLLYQESLPPLIRVEEHTAQLDHEKARAFQQEFRKGKIHVLSSSTTFELGVDLGDLDAIFLRNVPPEAFNYSQRVGRAGRRSYPGFAITYCRRRPHDLYYFAEPKQMIRGKVHPPAFSLKNEKIITRHITAVALSCFLREFPEKFSNVEALFGNLENPSGTDDFKSFLLRNQKKLKETLINIVPPDMVGELGLTNGSWIAKIAGENSRFSLTEAETTSDYQNVKSFEKSQAQQGNYDNAKWARARAKTISEEDVLSLLSRKAVIPKYGFPVDVVELDTQRTGEQQESSEVQLQRDLSIALSEFAPTSKIVADKREWTSYGLKKVAGKEWPEMLYKKCTKHNIFCRWKRGEDEPESSCQCNLSSHKYIVPLFGFLTNRDKPGEPKFRTQRVFTTRPYFAGTIDRNPQTLNMPKNNPLITIKKASPGTMVVLCEGRRNEGFYICNVCGAGFKGIKSPHKNPYNQDCSGKLERVSLGHEFVTDVVQLQFPKPASGDLKMIWFAYSLAYALVEGASEILEVPSTDLSATVSSTEQYELPPIILYDNVPGGAGLVAQLEDETVLKECLNAALRRVEGDCGCDEKTSCYGCLRNFRNQFAHRFLERGPVFQYLSELLSEWL